MTTVHFVAEVVHTAVRVGPYVVSAIVGAFLENKFVSKVKADVAAVKADIAAIKAAFEAAKKAA